jgi:uncharacterized protein YdaL
MDWMLLAPRPRRACALASVLLTLSTALGTMVVGCARQGEMTHDRGPASPLEPVAPLARASRSIAEGPEITIRNRAPDRTSVVGTATRTHPLPASGLGAYDAASARTLILYDVGGEEGWLGELYAIGAANLVSHFGHWRAVAARDYACGDMDSYTATIYVGSSFDEPLPPCLLDDVAASSHPVMWIDFNFWQLVAHLGDTECASRWGFSATRLDTSSRYVSVNYHGRTLTRSADDSGILTIDVRDPSLVTVLATAVRDDGTTAPWAVRSGNLTVISEIPFANVSEEDRVLAFDDILFDLLAPGTPERHRAMVRLEDIDPLTEPDDLHAIADYLSSRGVPFGFGVIAEHRDPTGYYNMGVPLNVPIAERPALVESLHYMEAHGGTMVMHGWTHQWDGGPNPYDGVSGDDTEFFRLVENPDETFSDVGPLPEDSVAWARSRIASAEVAFDGAGLTVPTIFEFPHYAASANSYAAVAAMMSARWERGTYFSGVLGGGPIDHTRPFAQMFPFVVRDVYGSTVLPENLGNIEPAIWHGLPSRSAADIVRAADRNLVVRDGVACFFFHSFYPLEDLQDTVEGIQALGYEFVSPTSL